MQVFPYFFSIFRAFSIRMIHLSCTLLWKFTNENPRIFNQTLYVYDIQSYFQHQKLLYGHSKLSILLFSFRFMIGHLYKLSYFLLSGPAFFSANWRYISLSCEYQSILSKQSVLPLSKCLITVLLFCYDFM